MPKIRVEGHVSKNLSTELLEGREEIVLPGLIFSRPVIGVDEEGEPFIFERIEKPDALGQAVKVRDSKIDPHITVTRRLAPNGPKVSVRIPLDQHP